MNVSRCRFLSGGRFVTVRGMYFGSAQTITVEFSHRKWNAKLKVCRARRNTCSTTSLFSGSRERYSRQRSSDNVNIPFSYAESSASVERVSGGAARREYVVGFRRRHLVDSEPHAISLYCRRSAQCVVESARFAVHGRRTQTSSREFDRSRVHARHTVVHRLFGMSIENVHIERHHVSTADETRDHDGHRSQSTTDARCVRLVRRQRHTLLFCSFRLR
jgi:hypothetical protein